MKNQYESGLNGEEIAEEYLMQQGMTVLARRYRGNDGEIDLILRDEDCIVFAEVKYRPRAAAGSGLLAITPSKQRRMLHAANAFMLENGWSDRSARFDAIEITRDGIIHIPNAFMQND